MIPKLLSLSIVIAQSMSALTITAIVLCALGVAASFSTRLPAVLASYAGLLCAHFAGAVYVDGSVLVFWAVATVLVLGLGYFNAGRVALMRPGNSYILTAAIAGTLLGFLVAPTAAALIGGSAIGAVLGAIAFRSTPRGPRALPLFSPVFINFMCASGLRAVVACSICGITVASLI